MGHYLIVALRLYIQVPKKRKGGLIEEEKREIKTPPNKQLIMDIGKTKYTVNLHFKQGTGETYKDKILKLIKRETEKI